jgi:hypothetical protein
MMRTDGVINERLRIIDLLTIKEVRQIELDVMSRGSDSQVSGHRV